MQLVTVQNNSKNPLIVGEKFLLPKQRRAVPLSVAEKAIGQHGGDKITVLGGLPKKTPQQAEPEPDIEMPGAVDESDPVEDEPAPPKRTRRSRSKRSSE